MYPQFLIIPALMITIYCHTPKNNSDVIVTYSGHAEAMHQAPILTTTVKEITTSTTESATEFIITTTEKKVVRKTKSTTPFYDEDTDSVVFIPNDAPDQRNHYSDYENHENVRVKDVLNKKGLSVADVLNEKRVIVETEAPKEDIVFISGKNGEHDNLEEAKKQKMRKNDNMHHSDDHYRRNYDDSEKETKPKVDCKKLDCNNKLNSVCGRKMERSQRRYRLFLNECYFNKVNCNFKYAENRFEMVPIEKCKNVADHYYTEKPFVYIPQHIYIPDLGSVRVKDKKKKQNRRTFSSRRSLNIDANGQFCSHPCPSSCPEQYEPECAMSNKGLKRVFVNHCKLDLNSCSYGAVWHRRPLSECVGAQKADMTRNSAFIGWMQRVGIVDNKGRLKLE